MKWESSELGRPGQTHQNSTCYEHLDYLSGKNDMPWKANKIRWAAYCKPFDLLTTHE